MMFVPLLGPRGDALDAVRYGFFLLSLLTAIFYLARTGGAWYPLMPWLKAVPIGALAIIALLSNPNGALLGWLLVAALVLSVAGDVFLALRDEQRWFVYGLGSFLLAHLAYIALFAVVIVSFGHRIVPWQVIALGLVAAFAAIMFATLRAKLGDMAVPVAVYMLVIVVMAGGALLVPATSPWIAVGALLFVASDGMIAIARFGTPFAGVHQLIWITYYLAQFFLLVGILRG